MIYTITTNPSLDYYMTFEEDVKAGKYSRSINEEYDAGGKGVNVSIYLNNLGINSNALGFLGGFTKDFYLSHLRQFEHIQPLFTSIKDNTRINIRVLSNVETVLNAKGPKISEDEILKFNTRLQKIYDNDIVVLSGNVQSELQHRMIELVHDLSKNNIKVILDTDLDIVEKCLDANLYCVKLNERTSSKVEEEVLAKAKHYLDNNVKYVMYSSLVSNSFYLISNEETLKTNAVRYVDTAIGSGDSMIAGFIYSDIRGGNQEELFRSAVTSSTILKMTNEKCDKKQFKEVYDALNIIKL